MTRLRKMMLEEIQRRNYSKNTAEAYIRALRDFAAFYHQPPDRLGPDHIRQYQLHLMKEKQLATKSVLQKREKAWTPISNFFLAHSMSSQLDILKRGEPWLCRAANTSKKVKKAYITASPGAFAGPSCVDSINSRAGTSLGCWSFERKSR